MYTDFRQTPTKVTEFASLKLIVCATMMGRCRFMTREDGWRSQNRPFPGAHSHAANDLLEYVVFDNAQIIPCYVIHLDLGRDAARYITSLSMDSNGYMSKYRELSRKEKYAQKKLKLSVVEPEERKQQRQALFAKAAKYFPYGYGSASGSKFVVEDVVQVSEDEEDYGKYQKERVDGIAEHDIWATDDHVRLAFDSDGELGNDEVGGDPCVDSKRCGDDNQEESEEGIGWESMMGPEGRTQFDEYYEARKAKNKKQTDVPKRRDW